MVELSLLDVIALSMGCETVSELHAMTDWQRQQLARKVERLGQDVARLEEWNDALCYLTQEPPQPSAELARGRLIRSLSQPREEAG